MLRLQAQRLVVARHRLALPTEQLQGDAAIAQRIRMRWISRQDLPVALQRSRHLALRQQRIGLLEHRLAHVASKAARMAATTPGQSPRRGCRNRRMLGYQGLSSRSSSHRQSGI